MPRARISALPSHLLLASGLAGGLLALLAPQASRASILLWSGTGTFASQATSWSPNQVPTSLDDLVFNVNAPYLAQFTSAVPASRTWTFRSGTPTVSVLGNHNVSSSIIIGDLAGDNPIVTLFNAGSITTSGLFIIADDFGSAGTLTASDPNVDLLLQTAAADLFVGNNGSGNLNVTSGGLVSTADRMLVSAGNASVSSVLVSGIGTMRRSTLEVLGAASTSAIGAGGDATLTVTDGGLASFSGSLNIAQGMFSESSASVGGGANGSELRVTGNLTIAGNQVAVTPGGVGSLTILERGSVVVSGTTNIATDPDGGTGTVTLNFGGSLSTRNLVVNDTNATLQHAAGLITINGGTFDPIGTSHTINGTSTPQLRFINGGSASFSSPTNALVVASLARGQLTATGTGSNIAITSGTAVFGDQTNSVGDARFSLNATLSAAPGTTVQFGRAGSGNVEFSEASANLDTLQIGAAPTGGGTLTMDNASVLTASGPISVGGTVFAQAGIGSLFINSGSVINANASSLAFAAWPSSAINLHAGTTLNAPNGRVDIAGALFLDSATINSQTVNIQPAVPRTYSMAGQINAQTNIQNTIATINLVGNLSVGSTSRPSAFNNVTGTFNVGNNTLTIASATTPNLGNITLGASGSLNVAPGSFPVGTLIAGKTLSGDGTVNLILNNTGSIVSTGDGLTFTRLVTGVPTNFSGAPTHWLSGGSFTGSGSLATKIRADTRAVFTATDDLFVGPNAAPDNIQFAGTVRTLDNNVNFYDSDGITLGILTELGGGLFRVTNDAGATQPTLLPAGSTIAGSGMFASSELTAEGTIDVGDTQSSQIGELMTTSFSLRPTAAVNVQISGDAVNQYDRLAAFSTANLGGTLNVSFLPGVNPTQPIQIPIIRAGSIMGTFAATHLPPRTVLTYTATEVILVFCPPDFNSSGTLSIQDIFDFLNAWFASNPTADFNQSGALSIQDIFDFLNSWFAGC